MRPGLALGLALALLAATLPEVPVAAAATLQVDVKNYSFTPKNASIAKGDTVKWRWLGGTHNVLADGTNAVWCSTRSTGECLRSFPATGNFSYHCGLHPSMRGHVFVDAGAPVLVITSPAEGAVVVGRFPASGTAAHPSGIDRVELQLGDGAWVLAQGGANWTAEVDSNPVPNGEQVLRARAVPVAGPSAEATVAVLVDNPPVTIAVHQPEPGAVVAAVALLAGTAAHPFNAVRDARWRLDGGAWQDLALEPGGQAAKWSGLLDATRLAPGPHVVEFQARDGYAPQDSALAARSIVVLGPGA